MKKERIILVFGAIGILMSITALASIDETQSLIDNNPIGTILIGNWDIDDFNYWGFLTNNTNYHICDGYNNTLDLRGKFIVGYDQENNDYDEIGVSLGNSTYNLSVAQLPRHRHTVDDWYPILSLQTVGLGQSFSLCKQVGVRSTYTGYEGSNADIDNRPSSIVVCYIQKIS